MSAVFEIHGDLPGLLRREWRDRKQLVLSVSRRASIKDVLEACGLPHTEIGRIIHRGAGIDFSFPVEDNQVFTVLPVTEPWDVAERSVLRPFPLKEIRFIVDVNVGRLARYLRMAGFDVLYDIRWSDEDIVDSLSVENRIVLTRDTGLLKRKKVEFGRYVRAEHPPQQLNEIIRLFGLERKLRLFSRCIVCNTLLEHVAKQDVLHRLEPLTRIYYDSFSICPSCSRVYWAGSHIDEMRRLLGERYWKRDGDKNGS